MNTVKELNITQKEYEEALNELYEALLGDNGEYHPWEELVQKINERYGFDENETV